MASWWPFSKKTDPFVEQVIQSLATNPDLWTLEETKEVERWEECDKSQPEARKSGRERWNYSLYEPTYECPIWRPVFRLKHTGGTIVLYDRDAKNYEGWIIEVPRHAPISDRDSTKLSRAVKKWREFMLAHDLTKHLPEQRLLAAAMTELEADLREKA